MNVICLIKGNKCGTDYFYPNCDISRLICDITGRKTISERIRGHMKDRGYHLHIEEEVKNGAK